MAHLPACLPTHLPTGILKCLAMPNCVLPAMMAGWCLWAHQLAPSIHAHGVLFLCSPRRCRTRLRWRAPAASPCARPCVRALCTALCTCQLLLCRWSAMCGLLASKGAPNLSCVCRVWHFSMLHCTCCILQSIRPFCLWDSGRCSPLKPGTPWQHSPWSNPDNGAMQRVHSLLLRAARRRGFLMPVQVDALVVAGINILFSSRMKSAALLDRQCKVLLAGQSRGLPRPCLPLAAGASKSHCLIPCPPNTCPIPQTQKNDLKETTFIQHPVECREWAGWGPRFSQGWINGSRRQDNRRSRHAMAACCHDSSMCALLLLTR